MMTSVIKLMPTVRLNSQLELTWKHTHGERGSCLCQGGRVMLELLFAYTVFTRIRAAKLIKFFAPQMRGLFEGGAYLKIEWDKGTFSFNLMVHFRSMREFYNN